MCRQEVYEQRLQQGLLQGALIILPNTGQYGSADLIGIDAYADRRSDLGKYRRSHRNMWMWQRSQDMPHPEHRYRNSTGQRKVSIGPDRILSSTLLGGSTRDGGLAGWMSPMVMERWRSRN